MSADWFVVAPVGAKLALTSTIKRGDELKMQKSHNCPKWISAQNAFLVVMEAVSVGRATTTPCHVWDRHSLTLSLSVYYP